MNQHVRFNMKELALFFSIACLLSSCAAGSAISVYAINARTADNLSSQAEQRIVERIKQEIAD